MNGPQRLALCLESVKAEPFVGMVERIVEPGPNMAWLRANSAVTRRAYDEMIAEREQVS